MTDEERKDEISKRLNVSALTDSEIQRAFQNIDFSKLEIHAIIFKILIDEADRRNIPL